MRRVATSLIAALLGWGCNMPAGAFREMIEPRAGAVLGRRVAVVYSTNYQIKAGGLERLHAFDINKYAKIYLALQEDGHVLPADIFVPHEVSRQDLLTVHTERYLRELARDSAALARYLEFAPAALMPAGLVDSMMLRSFRYATGGTLLAARLAVEHGVAVNIGGGYHHAEPDRGGGFCIYADMPAAIRCLQRDGLIRRALVVDLDAHQGNGTAVAFAGDDSVFTFSMQQEGIYPQPRARSDLDIELPAGTGDAEFMSILRDKLPAVVDESRPDIIFLQAGVDTMVGDPLAQLRMTERGIVERDAYVIDLAADRRIPLVMCLGGGYSRNAWHAQYLSIRRTIERYGLVDGQPAHPPRPPTFGERCYAG